MYRPSSMLSIKSHPRNILSSHLTKEEYNTTSPRTRRIAPLKTEYTVSSIISSEETDDMYSRYRSPSTRNNFIKIKQNSGYCTSERTKATKQTMNDSQNTSFPIQKSKSPFLKSRQQQSSHVTEIKQIVGYLIDKLMQKDFFQKQPSQIQTDMIKTRQLQLETAQSKTTHLLQEFENVKGLWQNANALRLEVMKYQEKSLSASNQLESHCKEPFLNEFAQLIHAFKQTESFGKKNELKLFQSRIADHLSDLKQKIISLQKSSTSKTSEQLNKMSNIIHNLQSRNKQLQGDNIKILQENQSIQQQLCNLHQHYRQKVSSLDQTVDDLTKDSRVKNVIEEQLNNCQIEIQTLRLEVANIEEEKQDALEQMVEMQKIIDRIEKEKIQLGQIIQHYEIKQQRQTITNSMIMSDLKSKISSLQTDVQTISNFKRTENTSVNPSEERIDNQQGSILKEVKESIIIQTDDLEMSEIEISVLRKEKGEIEEELRIYKERLNEKEVQQRLNEKEMQQRINEHKVLTETQTAQNILELLSDYMNKYSNYSADEKERGMQFLQKMLQSKSIQLPILSSPQDDSIIESLRQQSNLIHLSNRSISQRSGGEGQPTFMQIFSKFDERQESVFRIIDYIGSNLRSGDLLTQFVNEFIMKVMPNQDYEQYQKDTEQFIEKIKYYQQQRITVVDKALTDYIMNTQVIFKEKDQIEAILDQSSSDEDQSDKFLWQDILNPKESEQNIKITPKGRVQNHRVLAVNRKYSDKNKHIELLPIIMEEKTHKKTKSVVFSENDDVMFTPKRVSKVDKEEE